MINFLISLKYSKMKFTNMYNKNVFITVAYANNTIFHSGSSKSVFLMKLLEHGK